MTILKEKIHINTIREAFADIRELSLAARDKIHDGEYTTAIEFLTKINKLATIPELIPFSKSYDLSIIPDYSYLNPDHDAQKINHKIDWEAIARKFKYPDKLAMLTDFLINKKYTHEKISKQINVSSTAIGNEAARLQIRKKYRAVI